MDNQPIIYLNKEDINSFLSHNNASLDGFSYEWENERVVHVKMTPFNHSFGNVGRALFTLGGVDAEIDCNRTIWESSQYSFVVCVNNFRPRVFEVVNKKLVEREVNYIPSKDDLYSRSKGILEVNILESKANLNTVLVLQIT